MSDNVFLKRLELQGFKSFASKTVFEFDSEEVGVVGPNGSGKSNIIDAIRWVLGETGASYLRGDLLKNLIFAGTPKKSAASIARVTVVFDNSSDIFPMDTAEVSITRKIDKSGASDFLMNGNQVRLKDITPLLAKARLGSRGLMIIGQGQHDVFVRTSPQERREMIEEILGLKEYKIKKKTAERRLERSRINMDKMQAKLDELRPHLKFLRKQKKKWDKRKGVAEELEELSKKYFGFKYHKVNDQLSDLNEKLEDVRNKVEQKEERIKKIKEGVSKEEKEDQGPKREVREIRKKIKKLSRERSKLERKLARLEAKNEISAGSKKRKGPDPDAVLVAIRGFVSEVKPAFEQNDSNRLMDVVGKWLEKLNNLLNTEEEEDDVKQESGKEEINKVKESIKEHEDKIEKLYDDEEAIFEKQKKETDEFRESMEEMEKEKDALRDMDKQEQDLSLKKEKLQFKLKELGSRWHSLNTSQGSLSDLSRPEIDGTESWGKVESKINKLQMKMSEIGDIDKDLIDEAEEMEGRFQDMREEMDDMEKAAKDLEDLVEELEHKIHDDFKSAFSKINKEFNNYFRLMFGGGKARMSLDKPEPKEGEDQLDEEERELQAGVEISLSIPKKKIKGLEMLSGGEKTLVSLAALFALVSVSPPPFLVLDEIDAALDDVNSKRFADLINDFSQKTQFIVVTHNRITMEALDALYGITMADDGVSEVLSIRLQEAKQYIS